MEASKVNIILYGYENNYSTKRAFQRLEELEIPIEDITFKPVTWTVMGRGREHDKSHPVLPFLKSSNPLIIEVCPTIVFLVNNNYYMDIQGPLNIDYFVNTNIRENRKHPYLVLCNCLDKYSWDIRR